MKRRAQPPDLRPGRAQVQLRLHASAFFLPHFVGERILGIRGRVRHIDFMEVRHDQKIITHVPLHAGHTAPAGVSAGGVFNQNLHEVEIECTPDTLPEHIEVDVSAMKVGDLIHVGEIALPEGVRMVSHADVIAFEVFDPNAIEEAAPETPAEGEAAAEPEVIGEKERAEKAAAAEAEKAKK